MAVATSGPSSGCFILANRNGGRDRGAFSQVACEGARGTSGAPTASGTVAAHGRASKLPLSRAV